MQRWVELQVSYGISIDTPLDDPVQEVMRMLRIISGDETIAWHEINKEQKALFDACRVDQQDQASLLQV